MTDKSYLNVKYGNITTEIKMESVNRLGDLQDKIKPKFSGLKDFAPTHLQLYKENDIGGLEQITKWSEIKDLDSKYFEEDGLCLEIRTSLTQNTKLVDFAVNEFFTIDIRQGMIWEPNFTSEDSAETALDLHKSEIKRQVQAVESSMLFNQNLESVLSKFNVKLLFSPQSGLI